MTFLLLMVCCLVTSLPMVEGRLNTTVVSRYAQAQFNARSSQIICYSSEGTDTSSITFGYKIASSGQQRRISHFYLRPREKLGEVAGSKVWTLYGGPQYIVGGYYCQDGENRVVVIKHSPPEYAMKQLVAHTITASVGDDVTLETIKLRYRVGYRFRWFKDGLTEREDFFNKMNPLLADVSIEDAGIYQVVANGFPDVYSAMMRLIVRQCPKGRYGADCIKECPTCVNGGVCHDVTGECICPAGFTGPTCDQGCGPNKFGTECDKQCSYRRDNSRHNRDACRQMLFCLPDPIGCACAPGFWSTGCAKRCPKGSFGASCKQKCNCAGGKVCDRFTGQCPGVCAEGWTGTSCQIEGKPLIPPTISRFYNERVNEGQPAFFVCSVVGDPVPEADDIQLVASSGVEIMRVDSVIDEFNELNRTNTYLLSKTQHNLTYECTASTRAGRTSKKRLGQTYELPVLNEKATARDLSSNSAKIVWGVWQPRKDKGDAPVIRYEVEHRPVGSEKWLNSTVHPIFMNGQDLRNYEVSPDGVEDQLYLDMIGRNKNVSFDISGLKPFTNYETRIISIRPGIGGKGHSGPVSTFQTLCDEPLLAPLKVAVSMEKTCDSEGASPSYNLKITWQPPPRETLQCDRIGHYRLYWKHGNLVSFQSLDIPSSKKQTTLRNIPPTDTVFIRMSVVNNANFESARSDIRSVEIGPAEPSDVTDLNVFDKKSDSFKVSWGEPEVKNGDVVHYEGTLLHLCTNQCPCSPGATSTLSNITSLNVDINDLMPDSLYRISIRAVSTGGIGPVSTVETSTAPALPSVAPGGANVQDIKSLRALFEWEPLACEHLNGPLLHYNVLVFKVEDGHLVQQLKVVHSTRVLLTGLTPNTAYTASVSVQNPAGVGPVSKEIVFVTEIDRLGEVKDIRAEAKSSKEIQVNWAQPDVTNGPLNHYEVTVQILCVSWCECFDDGESVTTSTEATGILLGGLKRNTKYRLTVIATNDAGKGPARYVEHWTAP